MNLWQKHEKKKKLNYITSYTLRRPVCLTIYETFKRTSPLSCNLYMYVSLFKVPDI